VCTAFRCCSSSSAGGSPDPPDGAAPESAMSSIFETGFAVFRIRSEPESRRRNGGGCAGAKRMGRMREVPSAFRRMWCTFRAVSFLSGPETAMKWA